MDDHIRHDGGNNDRSQGASNGGEVDQHDDVSRRRDAGREQSDERNGGRPALTRREREERWPIG